MWTWRSCRSVREFSLRKRLAQGASEKGWSRPAPSAPCALCWWLKVIETHRLHQWISNFLLHLKKLKKVPLSLWHSIIFYQLLTIIGEPKLIKADPSNNPRPCLRTTGVDNNEAVCVCVWTVCVCVCGFISSRRNSCDTNPWHHDNTYKTTWKESPGDQEDVLTCFFF